MAFKIKVLKNGMNTMNTMNSIKNDTDDMILIKSLLNEVTQLKKEMNIIKSNKRNNKNDIEELKIKTIDISEEKIKKYLSYKSIQGEIKFFKEIYLNKNGKNSIKYLKGRTFKYWDGENWITDIGGLYIANIILKNIQNSYLRVNKYKTNNGYNDIDIFISNQIKLQKLMEEQYKKDFIRSIKELIYVDEKDI